MFKKNVDKKLVKCLEEVDKVISNCFPTTKELKQTCTFIPIVFEI